MERDTARIRATKGSIIVQGKPLLPVPQDHGGSVSLSKQTGALFVVLFFDCRVFNNFCLVQNMRGYYGKCI